MTTFRTISRQLAFLRDVQHGQESCIIWPYGINRGNGYGQYRNDNVTLYVHHTACEWENGPRPVGTDAAHECGNRRCVNQKHLSWKTPKENMLDQKRHGTWPSGEQNGNSKLTAEQVAEIRERFTRGSSNRLAREYGVTGATIRSIVNGKRWRVS